MLWYLAGGGAVSSLATGSAVDAAAGLWLLLLFLLLFLLLRRDGLASPDASPTLHRRACSLVLRLGAGQPFELVPDRPSR
jgi:hypothetical protein